MKKEQEENLEKLELQYADDINYICENYALVEAHKKSIPAKLEKRKLLCNHSKDEEYFISRKKYDPSQCINCAECSRCGNCKKCKECMYCKNWRSCKCLGSMIDTPTDIKRRKRRKHRYVEESTVYSPGQQSSWDVPDGNEDIIQVWPPPRIAFVKTFLCQRKDLFELTR